MKTRLFLSLLGFACLLSTVTSQCDLTARKQDVDFPDIMKFVADTYIMGVMYSVPGAKQTDYYTEYYEATFHRGRVDSHIRGENVVFIYSAETFESWTIQNNKCDFKLINITAGFFKDAQTDWYHYTDLNISDFTDGEEMPPTTIGPSAMFKVANDVWKSQKKLKERTMAYMGPAKDLIRGEKAVFWRRCTENGTYVDYFFADSIEENPYDSGMGKTPLSVDFYGVSATEEKELSKQFYDIVSFQPVIKAGVEPFQLPKGKNCKRGPMADGPLLPDFSSSNLLLSAEVLYRKYSIKDDENELMSSYYSTLTLALDREINHLAYSYSSWNTSKPDKDHTEPFLNAPRRIVYDMSHQYAYNISFETAKCEVSRRKSFIPRYKLPENGGYVSLTDPYILFPNNELKFLTEGKDRGLAVNIYENEITGYVLDEDTVIPRAIVSHSYLKFNEELENTVSVRNAPTQMELRLYRKDDIEEVLTFNVFGFTTKLPKRRFLFDVTRCFKNDDDYTFLTIGFEIESKYLTQIEKKLPEIEENVFREVTMKSELNPVRIPAIMTDMKKNYVYVTMVVLGKPTLQLDFLDEKDMTIPVTSPDDTQGVSNFDTCANNCLESRSGCWGFSLCGATCYYGSDTNTKVEPKKNCTVYRRYSNDTFMPSKELQVENIVRQVEAEEFKTMVTLDSGERIEITATIAQVTDPAEDDSLFEKMGNLLNPRMRVLKAGSKLKKGSTVKNLGKLRYDECQSLCLDFKDCETISYCLIDADCSISTTYGSDLKAGDMVPDEFCNLLTRKYTDHFDRTPGVFVSLKSGTKLDLPKVEDCARACLQHDKFKCLSFDHCAGGEKQGCTLYSVHYLNPKDRKEVENKSPRCGHYSRKFSNEFKRKDETRILGSKVPPIMNLTLEECAKSCMDYSEGPCYGYDFCQDKTLYATSCTLFNTDPSRLKTSYSPICTNFLKSAVEYTPRPFTSGYAGGIGFLCFLVGGVVGAIFVFVIAYIRVNRG